MTVAIFRPAAHQEMESLPEINTIDKGPTVRFMLDEPRARRNAAPIATRADRLTRQVHDGAWISLEILAAGAELGTAATRAHTGIVKPLSQ